jgi:hypothetical protein
MQCFLLIYFRTKYIHVIIVLWHLYIPFEAMPIFEAVPEIRVFSFNKNIKKKIHLDTIKHIECMLIINYAFF